jgi:acyl-CoA dehydrogenase
MSETSSMIEESIQRILADQVDRKVLDAVEAGDWPHALWNALEQAGFTDILVATDDESATQWADAYPMFHAIGRYAAPVPLAETAVANHLIAKHGLPRRAGALTFVDAGTGATFSDGLLTLHATVAAVPWASRAGALVVTARVDGAQIIALVDANAAGLQIKPGANLAGEPLDMVTFDACRTRTFQQVDRDIDLTVYGALIRAAMMAGAVEAVLVSAVEYANERVQFGRPIGKFQAIQQSLAQLAGEATSSQCAALAAFSCVDEAPGRFETAVAKIRAGKAAGLAAGIAHQVHGAIGFTWEHTLHYATQRLWSWRAEYGTEAGWAGELGRAAIARRGAGFWSELTSHYRAGVSEAAAAAASQAGAQR